MLRRFYTHWLASFTGIPQKIWFLSLVSMVNRCGAMVLAFMTVYLTQQLHFGLRDAGYVLGCFGVGALLGAFSGGKLTDKFGYYNIQIWSLVLNGLVLIALLSIRSFEWMCLGVFVLSLVSEIFRPANAVAIARHSTPETRTRSISLYRLAVNLGWTVAPAAGGLLAALGWNWLFWVDGLTCLIAAMLLRWLVPPVKAAAVEHNDQQLPEEPHLSPYRDKPYLAFCALTFINAIIFMQFIWTIPLFFKTVYHWPEAKIGLVAALNGFIVFLVEMPLIYQIDGRRRPTSFIRRGLVLYALAYSVFLIPTSFAMAPALLYVVAMSFGEMLVMPFSTNFSYDRAKSQGSQGQYMAVYTMSYSLANIVAPLLGTQVVAAFGFNTLWVTMVALALIGMYGFWWLENRLHRPVLQVA
ncbi:MAG: MFS transporter [Lewinellaceae bacterium]|nr:MFS transporter [Lewinellaceae bacterium]